MGKKTYEVWQKITHDLYLGEYEAEDRDEAIELAMNDLPMSREIDDDTYDTTEEMIAEPHGENCECEDCETCFHCGKKLGIGNNDCEHCLNEDDVVTINKEANQDEIQRT